VQQTLEDAMGGVKDIYMDARRYTQLTGKTVRGTVRIWDSKLAGVARLWAKDQGAEALDRFLDEAYPRFWRRELGIDRIDTRDTPQRLDGLRCVRPWPR
jgi:hypothetical protein